MRVAYTTIGRQEDTQLPSTQWGQDWCLASAGKEQCGPGEFLAVPQAAIQGPYPEQNLTSSACPKSRWTLSEGTDFCPLFVKKDAIQQEEN